MKKFVILILFLCINSTFAQGEANIWYFGDRAGLDFNSGSPIALTNGQMNTTEGCSVLSNNMGLLIFYTNGVTVYNRNHQVMVNGTGLMGDDSTTQSSVIIQKPGSTHLYYIFTLDNEVNADGFRYSIVDMNLDNGLGAVTSDKNILIYTPSCEKMSMVKHANNSDYWIVTHGWNNNTFYSHLLTASGLNPTPVLSNVGNNIPINVFDLDAYAGALKISPDGTKIACTNEKHLELFDFDKVTGILSNPNLIYVDPFWSAIIIGLEFSIDNKILYATSQSKVLQFNLLANPISSSMIVVGENFSNLALALQLGPDNKIYIANRESNKLGVINYPTTLGVSCNYQDNVIDLGGKICLNGLPNFCQSFFIPLSINVSNTCLNDSTTFSFTPNQSAISATWNFGDGNTSSALSPTHTYTTTGTYNVSVQIVTAQGTTNTTRVITIYPKPILLQNTINLKQCDDDNDGFSAFNLTQANQLLVASTAGLSFSYHTTLAEAQSNSNPISNISAYVNTSVSNSQVFVRVTNANGCYSTATINLLVSTTLIPASFQRTFISCDDAASGSSTDGISSFNFNSVTSEIQALYPPGQVLEIKYYKNLADALSEQNAINNIASFVNTVPNQQNIYIRVDSLLDNACLGLGHHITLKVEPIPIIQPISYRNCDDNHDGITSFNTSSTNATLLNGLSNVGLSFWDQNNNPLPSPLPNPFFTTSQMVKVRATNLTTNACFYETNITFTVDDLPEIFPIPANLTTKCDDETNPSLQDGLYSFDTSNFQNILLGNQQGMLVKYFAANGNPLPSPLPNSFLSGSQNITVEIINTQNNNCKVTGTISLIVNPIPNIEMTDNELICSDNPLFTKTIDAGLHSNANVLDFTYQWFKDGVLLPTAQNHQLIVNSQGIYKVVVSNLLGCSTTRTITVSASNKAKIENVEVIDFSEENAITVLVSGLGIYEYSLDDENYQTSNTFNNLEFGIYTIYIKDIKGCGIVKENVSVLGASKFFTPNGDSYNDYWNIKGVNKQTNTIESIHIYDRYGSLLTQINPIKQGWDGTCNGKPMPASDYWYVIKLKTGKIIKGHFSLKR